MFVLFNYFAISERNYYIKVNDDGTWSETYNPEEATLFPTKQEALIWGKTNTRFADYQHSISLENAKKIFEEWKKGGMICRTLPIINHKISRPYKDESPDEVLKWHIDCKLSNEESVLHEHVKTWPQLYDMFSCLWMVVIYLSSNKKSLSFMMVVDDNTQFHIFEEELNKILPHITVRMNDARVIDILDKRAESSLFCVHDDGTYSIQESIVAGRYHELYRSNSLENVFNHWKKYHSREKLLK